ncbi:MAG TPA: c-type cytochrome [Sphingobacteriaceae bacterium]|nr:c-type cytochrome [Sphingobacteriaceae bacterium]
MKLKFIFSSCLFIVTLGSGFAALSQTSKTKTSAKPVLKNASVQKPLASKQDIEDGKQLISKSDCVACHSPENKMVGPAYKDVAKKYAATEANINRLVLKVINGGSGVWGEIPMSPHPALPSADVKKMVKYVLSLKAK